MVAEEAMVTEAEMEPLTESEIPVAVGDKGDKQAGNVPPATNTALTISPLEGV